MFVNVIEEKECYFFFYYFWNLFFMFVEFIEVGILGLDIFWLGFGGEIKDFDVMGLEMVELGVGMVLLSIMGGLMGSKRVVVIDYFVLEVIKIFKENVLRGVEKKNGVDGRYCFEEVVVEGYGWGELEMLLVEGNKY